VMSLEDKKYTWDNFLDLYSETKEGKKRVLFISEEHIALIEDDTPTWEMLMNQFDQVERIQNSLIFKGKDINVQYEFKLKEEKDAEVLYSRLDCILNNQYD